MYSIGETNFEKITESALSEIAMLHLESQGNHHYSHKIARKIFSNLEKQQTSITKKRKVPTNPFVVTSNNL